MDVGKSFSYISEDDQWVKKLGIGALIGMIPILNFAAMGYQVQIARNVVQGEERPLPAWDEFGQIFMDGLRVVAAMMLYVLPLMLIYGCLAGAVVAFSLSLDSGALDPAAMTGETFPAVIITMFSLSMLCLMPYSLILWGLYPLFFIQIARRESVKACFDFREMIALLRSQPVDYLIVLAITFGLYMAVGLVLTPIFLVAAFIPCIGFLITMLLSGAVTMLVGAVAGHLEGQFIMAVDAG